MPRSTPASVCTISIPLATPTAENTPLLVWSEPATLLSSLTPDHG